MKHHTSLRRRLPVVTLITLVFALASPVGWADDDEDELTLATLKFFIELNEPDQDVGVQALLGGEPYKKLVAYRPDGRKILNLRPSGSLRQQGMSDFFFESAEPSFDEVSLDTFLARFPEGMYEFETKTLDGIEQDGETLFTHVMPAGPVIIHPTEGEMVLPDNLEIIWEPVTQTTAFNPPQQECTTTDDTDDTDDTPCKIIGYQVILTREDPLRVYSVDVSADTQSITVNLEPGTEYELEILAIEESDNQTISLLFFETE